MTEFNKIAISVPVVHENPEELFNTSLGGFSRIEIDGEYLGKHGFSSVIVRRGLEVVSVVNLVHHSLFANLSPDDCKMTREFLKVINSVILKEYGFGIGNFVFEIGHDLTDGAQFRKALWFLRAVSNSVFRKQLKICIPMTLPDTNAKEAGENLKSLIRGIMLTNFKACLNIYIHEVKSNVIPRDIYSMARFDLGLVRLIYEPGTGNYVTGALLNRWLDPLDDIKYEGPVVLCPKVNSISMFENELKRLGELAR